MNVLIVEDDAPLARELGLFLHNTGYVCEVARTAREATERLFVATYDFVLLDLGLPDRDGLTVLADARQQHNQAAAIIILSARGAVEDRVQSLDLGADDYLPKPYSLLELVSRMQAITRRKFNAPQDVLAFGPFALRVRERQLTGPHDAEIGLTRKEFDLLHYLLLHAPKVLTRQQLIQHLWGDLLGTAESDSNFVDVHVKNLRRKLAAHVAAGEPDWVETVRGVGYRLRKPAPDGPAPSLPE
ncbi:MAG: response regulator transcription factor [Hymenobacteraceae bacterium]|nr:response regulator transcription factor [Hymenobacteraceae bacterium]